MPEPSDVIYLRNSPDTPITITRGGDDPITGEPRPEQWVTLSWEQTFIGPDGTEQTETRQTGFMGP